MLLPVVIKCDIRRMGMDFSYILYIAIFVYCLIAGMRAEKLDKKKAIYPIIIVLTFVAGLRNYTFESGVGIDTKFYAMDFEKIANGLSYDVYWEKGFTCFCKALQMISKHPSFIFTVCALIIYGLIILRLWDFRHIASFGVMVTCFYVMFYFKSLNTIRQFVAVAIVFYFSRYIQKRKYLKFLFGMILALVFHKSAILGMLLLVTDVFFWKNLTKKQKLFLCLLMLISPIVIVYALNVFIAEYAIYFLELNVDVGFLLIGKIAFFVVSAVLANIWYRDDRFGEALEVGSIWRNNRYVYRTVGLYYFVGLLLSMLGYYFAFMERAGLYLYVFESVFFGILMKRTKINVISKKQFVYAVGIFILLGWTFVGALIGDGYGVLPYKFFWQ